jgi:hypothetical protein
MSRITSIKTSRPLPHILRGWRCRFRHSAASRLVWSSLQGRSGAGRLADELRQDYPDLSDLHFWGVVLAVVDAIREVALTMLARNHVDSGARLKLFAMGLGVVPERRETIRALLLHDIDVLLGGQTPSGLSSSGQGDDAGASKSRPASVAAPQATTSAAKCR